MMGNLGGLLVSGPSDKQMVVPFSKEGKHL